MFCRAFILNRRTPFPLLSVEFNIYLYNYDTVRTTIGTRRVVLIGISYSYLTSKYIPPLAKYNSNDSKVVTLLMPSCWRRKCSRVIDTEDICGEAYFRNMTWDGQSSLYERLSNAELTSWSWIPKNSGQPRIPRGRANEEPWQKADRDKVLVV
jgi:hypothetical protein